jgi:hypothetical protein
MKNSILQKKPPFSFKNVVVPKPSEVNSYLNRHPELSSVLPGVVKAVRLEFDQRAELTLEVNHDPEIDDRYLTLIVRLPSYDKSTMKRIDAIWGQFEKKISKSSGWLTLTTDFRLLKATHGL